MTHPIVLQELGRQRPDVKRTLRGGKREMLIAALRNSPLFTYATDKDLRNVVKHAHAKSVRIEISAEEGKLMLEVRDDGDGFEASAAPRGRWSA